eukprot:12898897-Ditylum_brightwellii.AAC.1
MMDKKGHEDTVNPSTYKCAINHDDTKCKNCGVIFPAASNPPANEQFIGVIRRNLTYTCNNYSYG